MSDNHLIERKDLDIDLLDENEGNPNVMGKRAFDLLVDNMQSQGCTENVVVRPVDDRYRIVSGHHRVKAARYLGWETVPCAIILDPAFDEEKETFQLVRMNMIKGKLDPQLFYEQYQKVAGKYGDDLIQDMFGFADDNEFKRLITQTAKSLPDELKEKFKEAAKQVKTIDQLAAVLNHLFATYGDTVPYAFMVFDHGNQKNFWIRIEKKTFTALSLIGDLCCEMSITMDDVLGALIQRIAKGEDDHLAEIMSEIVDKAPKVVIPTGLAVAPTKEHLEAAASI